MGIKLKYKLKFPTLARRAIVVDRQKVSKMLKEKLKEILKIIGTK